MEQEEFDLVERRVKDIFDNSSREDLEALCSFSGLSTMRKRTKI